MSIPLNELCVAAFQKLRDWVKGHPKFTSVLEEYKKDSNFAMAWIINGNIEHYLNAPFTCTEILGFLERGIEDGYLVELECSTTGRLDIALGEDLVIKLKEKGIVHSEIDRLKGFAVYFYNIWLKSIA